MALYFGSLVFLLFILEPVYKRYKAYRYIDNFRGEIITLYWRLLHVAFFLIVVSGALLVGFKGKPILQGAYGFVFSAKMALWLLQLYLTQSYLKPFILQTSEPDKETTAATDKLYPVGILFILLLIAVAGFALKYV